jgi:hypothetical protein
MKNRIKTVAKGKKSSVTNEASKDLREEANVTCLFLY